MGLPSPIYPLSGHCSVVHDGTLYVYSSAGFQSLALAQGGKWKTLPMDISLTGAQCVMAVPGGKKEAAMLYVVGGSPNATAAPWQYPGLMHYSFADRKWDWVRPESYVTQNRQNHAAVYLDDAKAILVYSGSQSEDKAAPSSETFLISTEEPFGIRSSPSADAPPLVKPILMPWDSSHAVMIGGGATNDAVFTFAESEGWKDLGVTLAAPIANQNAVQCAVVSGTDGSKVLEQFDMSVSPNKVTRTALLNQGGTVAASGTTVGDKTKRLTVQDWPAYNASLAPTVARTGYSLAQGDDNQVVVTGGTEEDPLCIFDSAQNEWVNATELFAGKQMQSLLQPTSSMQSSATSSAASTTTSASSTSNTAAPAAAPSDNKDRMLTVLGATLGAIFGVAALLILLLFCLRYRKSKRQKPQGGYIEKDRLSFADRGAEFMSEAGGSVGHKFAEVNASQTTLAMNGRTLGHQKGMLSDASTAGLVRKASPLGYAEPVELSKFDIKPERLEPIEQPVARQNSGRTPPPARPTANLNRSRSSGWSRYFANNEATNLAQMPADRSTYASERTSTGSHSNYTDSRMYSQPSQAVPPLEIPRFDGQRVNKVARGSPTLGNSQENLHGQAMQAQLARANSNGSTHSGISHDGHYLRDGVDSWSPVNGDDRPSSSNYTGSVVINDYRDGPHSYYQDNASSYYPKSTTSSFYPDQSRSGALDSFYPAPPRVGAAPEDRESTVTVFPSSNPDNNARAQPTGNFSSFHPTAPRLGAAPEDRESTVTVFPRGAEGGSKNGQQDMSWLNLGAGR